MARLQVYRALDWVGRRVLPARCVLCRGAGAVPGVDLCAACDTDLPRIDHPCPRCGLPAEGALLDGCRQCRGQTQPYVRLVAPFAFAFPVDELVHALKYRGSLANARVLGELLARTIGHCDAEAVVPLPLHPSRLVERGFNQSYEIARCAGRALGVPCEPRLLQRVRETPPQVGLARDARRANVQGAFAAAAGVAGRRIALLDDVVTTGATVAAASVALLGAGAATVEVWAVARALG